MLNFNATRKLKPRLFAYLNTLNVKLQSTKPGITSANTHLNTLNVKLQYISSYQLRKTLEFKYIKC